MSDRFEQLWTNYLEGDLDEAGMHELASILESDASLAQRAADLYEEHRLLGMTFQDETPDAFVSETLRRVDEDQDAFVRSVTARTSDGSGASQRSGVLATLWRVSSYAAVAAIAFCASLLFQQARVGDGLTPSGTDAPDAPTVRYVTADYVATIVRAEGCRWAGGVLPEGERILAGPLRLLEGVAVIRFDAGVSVAMVGPAELDIESVDGVALRRGAVTARSGDGFTGFAVRTSAADFIDWGAEFAVSVDADGTTALQVHTGRVEVMDRRSVEPTFVDSAKGLRYAPAGAEPRDIAVTAPRFESLMQQASDPRDAGELHVHDRFAYEEGRVQERDGGSGWIGRWVRGGFKTDWPVYVSGDENLDGPSPLVRSTGGLLRLTGTDHSRVYKRQLAHPLKLGDNGIQYVSFLIQGPPQLSDEQHWFNFKWTSRSHRGVGVMIGAREDGYARLYLRGAGHTTGDKRIEPGWPYLFVGKVVTAEKGPDQLFVKVFAPGDRLDLREPTEWTIVSRPTFLDATLDEIHIAWHDHRDSMLDEVRIGTTWASVVPVDARLMREAADGGMLFAPAVALR